MELFKSSKEAPCSRTEKSILLISAESKYNSMVFNAMQFLVKACVNFVAPQTCQANNVFVSVTTVQLALCKVLGTPANVLAARLR